jgi:hypothetical protein
MKNFISYRQKGQAFFEEEFSKNFPVLIVESSKFDVDALLPKDQEFIHSNFIPYFGNKFWIYGFQIKGNDLKKGVKLELKARGPYTLNGAHQDLLIDGRPADTPVYLESGFHVVECRQECGDIVLTYGARPIDQVIPNFTLQPDSAGVVRIETPGRYYLASNSPETVTNPVLIDSSAVIHSQKLEKQLSICLAEGEHTYKNPLNRPVTFHLIGPFFVMNIHRF